MHKVLLSVLLGFVLIFAGGSAFAFNSGAIEVGDLATGSIVGQPFKHLNVDLEFIALKVGGHPAWYPPTSILNLRNAGTGGARAGQPIVFKVTNALDKPHAFTLSADSAFAAPSSMQVNVVLKPGETKYIGISMSHFTYVTASGSLKYKCSLHGKHLTGQLLVPK